MTCTVNPRGLNPPSPPFAKRGERQYSVHAPSGYDDFRKSPYPAPPALPPGKRTKDSPRPREGPRRGGSGGGIVNTAPMKTGRVTLARISLHGERFRMHIVAGEGVKPRSWEELGWAPPAPYFPSLEIIPDCGVEEFAQKALAQHYAVVYGDHRQKLVDLCNLLDIEVI